ncbi:MAG: hypothetical protein ACKVJU_16905 [Verrucomicrobiales bacterium]
MSSHDPIDSFVKDVKGRLNRFRFLDTLFWALMIVAAALLVVCLVYVIRGYAVPKLWYAISAGLLAISTLGVFGVRRWNGDGAASFADRFFGLKDSIATTQHFRKEHREGDFVELQKNATTAKVEPLTSAAIPYETPVKLIVSGLVMVLVCSLLAFKAPAPHILEKQRIETETAAKTTEINEFLEEMIEELKKESNEEELKTLDPEKLKEWVKELDDTKDRKEAMRQYAQLERKLQEAAKRLDQRKNEEMLAKVGKEIKKNDENKALGKKLEEKKFDEAAEELKAMKPSEQPKELSEQRKELARLKSAAQRMAAAAKNANRKSSSASNSEKGNKSNSSGSKSKSKESSGNSGEAQGSRAQGSEGELSDQLGQLEKSVKKLDEALKNAELQKKQMGKLSDKMAGECKDCKNMVLSDLDKLSESMRKIGQMKDSQSKLLSMCKKLGQCQGFLGEPKFSSLSQSMSPNVGGKKAGMGSTESRTDQSTELTDNGNTTQLKGQKGQGPSMATVESADDGDGVSSRRAGAAKREFSEQLESFVHREDVPEDVKEGVKEYFKNIHGSEAQ